MKNKNTMRKLRDQTYERPYPTENVEVTLRGQYGLFNTTIYRDGDEIFSKMKDFYMDEDNIMWYLQEPDLYLRVVDHISDEEYSKLEPSEQEFYSKGMVDGDDGWPRYEDGWTKHERSPFNKVIFKLNGQIFQIAIDKIKQIFEISPYIMTGFELSYFWKIRKIGKQEISNLWKRDLESLNLNKKITEKNVSDMLSFLTEDV
jgi:hypothetical protein